MIALHVSRLLAAAGFVVLGIVWSGNHSLTVAIWWAICFALSAVFTILADMPADKRPTLGDVWAKVPGSSKEWTDYV
ncbi:MAG TPA: hypothetical protein VGM91_09695 [Conexibacter sp.]|jgi:hypothetical protein